MNASFTFLHLIINKVNLLCKDEKRSIQFKKNKKYEQFNYLATHIINKIKQAIS